MSDPLTQSFDNPSVTSHPLSPFDQPNTGSGPPMQLSIPQIQTNGRRLYYGIETTEKWLMEYTKADFRRRSYIPEHPPSALLLMSESLLLLQKHSGVRPLRVKSVLPQGAPIPPRRKGNRQTLPLPDPGEPIVAICSSHPKWFGKRPSQAQVEVLKRLMGGKEPRWWVSDDQEC